MKSYKVLCIYQVENPNLWIILQGNLLWHVKKWNWELKGLSSSLHGWLAFWSDKFLTPLSLRFLVCQMENKNALRVVRIYVDDTDKNSAYVKCNSDVTYFNKQWLLYVSFLKILFILFLDTEEGREKRRRETSMCGCLSHIPYWEPGLQPRPVPWLGIEPVTLWFTGRWSIHWATPARAICQIF